MQASESEAGSQERFGPFQVSKRIAVGGSAEVFLARRDDTPDIQMVLKRLLPGTRATSDLGDLQREARLHQCVRHPNVVRIYHAGVFEGEPYIAMEHVSGLDLHQVLTRSSSHGQALPHDLAVFIIRNVADALEAVHSATNPNGQPLAIVHGDVSPSNIYLSDQGETKLGDFGLARIAEQSDKGSNKQRAVGHFGFLAPEQLDGEAPSQQSDVFSLAVILGELLIGRRIFPGSGQLAVMLSIRDADISPLREAAPGLPPGLFEVCERALHREPEKRWGSASEFAEALKPFEGRDRAQLKKALAGWVTWATDHDAFAENVEKRVRESLSLTQAAQRSSSTLRAIKDLEPRATDAPKVRRAGDHRVVEVPFAKLVEMVATGELSPQDEVALWGAPFEAVDRIEELARHLLPSTTGTTGRMFSLNPPDYVAEFSETPFLKVLAKLHNEQQTGLVFVSHSFQDRQQRKDIYVKDGRLLHVASNDPHELLGEYLVNKGVLKRRHLEAALQRMAATNSQLGETLISLRMVSAVDMFTALRNQGRDRVAGLCQWSAGIAQLYQGAKPGQVMFSLDLDLTIAMMWGAMQAGERAPETDLRLTATPAAPRPGEKGSSVSLLNHIPGLARKNVPLHLARQELITVSNKKSEAAARQAEASLVVAEALGWVRFA